MIFLSCDGNKLDNLYFLILGLKKWIIGIVKINHEWSKYIFVYIKGNSTNIANCLKK